MYKEHISWRCSKLPWRNWLARSAVNRKVGGSSPPGSDVFGLFLNSPVKFILDGETKIRIACSIKPAWRNGLARWTSNPKVVGSTPTVGAFYFLIYCVKSQ